MSLILEALRKLEREKQTPERAVVVMGAHDWARPEARHGLRWLLRALAAGALVALGAGGTWWFMRPPAAAPAAATMTSPAPGRTATDAPSPGPAVAATTPQATVAAPARAATPRPARALGPSLDDAQASPPGVALDGAPEDGPVADARLDLQAISERDGEPIAILGGRMVRVGDAFDDVRVLRIGVGEVELEVAGQRRVLRF